MSNSLDIVTLNTDADADSIVNLVKEFGIAMIPGYFDSVVIAGLNDEFDRFFEQTQRENASALIEMDEGVTIPVVRKDIDTSRYPTTAEVFASQLMRDVSEKYLATPEIGLNHQIYVNLNKGTTAPVDKLPFLPHFDKISTFKFFVYLTDTTAENGAMGAVLGSQIENRRLRDADHARKGETKTIENVIEKPPLVPVEGRAGTMFIFDTDMTHQAGFVRQGKERRIMRGHTRTIEVLKQLRLEHQAA